MTDEVQAARRRMGLCAMDDGRKVFRETPFCSQCFYDLTPVHLAGLQRGRLEFWTARSIQYLKDRRSSIKAFGGGRRAPR